MAAKVLPKAGGRTDDRSQVEPPNECENGRSLKRERGGLGTCEILPLSDPSPGAGLT